MIVCFWFIISANLLAIAKPLFFAYVIPISVWIANFGKWKRNLIKPRRDCSFLVKLDILPLKRESFQWIYCFYAGFFTIYSQCGFWDLAVVCFFWASRALSPLKIKCPKYHLVGLVLWFLLLWGLKLLSIFNSVFDQGGVQRVHLLDGTIGGVLLKELFQRDGVGTMVARYATSLADISLKLFSSYISFPWMFSL